MAIALDATSAGANGATSSLSVSHTCTGSDRILFVFVETEPNGRLTGVTYAGQAMTLLASVTDLGFSNAELFLYYIVAPATGANNIVASLNASTNVHMAAASYTGASQTGVPDSQAVLSENVSASQTLTTTVVAANSWLVGVTINGNAAAVAGANTVIRSTQPAWNNMALIDSNGAQASGSRSMAITWGGVPTTNAGIIVSFAPPSAVVPSKFLAFF